MANDRLKAGYAYAFSGEVFPLSVDSAFFMGYNEGFDDGFSDALIVAEAVAEAVEELEAQEAWAGRMAEAHTFGSSGDAVRRFFSVLFGL
jgi:hypothetical protein